MQLNSSGTLSTSIDSIDSTRGQTSQGELFACTAHTTSSPGLDQSLPRNRSAKGLATSGSRTILAREPGTLISTVHALSPLARFYPVGDPPGLELNQHPSDSIGKSRERLSRFLSSSRVPKVLKHTATDSVGDLQLNAPPRYAPIAYISRLDS